ncbi:2-amino-4-hydroxy-6-hydroxymethyldihydropteridine diphosphokinase [Spirochaetia bacterium]|nr:2-amino-4-hydroxy-6-hydroxymethyldihydropteridine diphosphokinase [Spirochaetia bacterium]
MPCPSQQNPPGTALAVLGLGSNRGDSTSILWGAIKALAGLLEGLREARVLESEPLHVTDQARFFNTAVSGFYRGEPLELLKEIHQIEASFGRNRRQERRWGERTLDIDILLFGSQIISLPPQLEIPHPRLKDASIWWISFNSSRGSPR